MGRPRKKTQTFTFCVFLRMEKPRKQKARGWKDLLKKASGDRNKTAQGFCVFLEDGEDLFKKVKPQEDGKTSKTKSQRMERPLKKS